VFGAAEIYRHPERAGKAVAILGGGLVGAELGIYLSMLGRKVTILEMLPTLNYGASGVHGAFLDLKIQELGIVLELSARAAGIDEKGVIAEDGNGNIKRIAADTVIYAVGMRPTLEQADALRQAAGEFYQIGDALSPRQY
jgi:pyruvate/2-oxoglutarate dehydrogenase complex dihydrolipoamide dehydrogenase (E3) component